MVRHDRIKKQDIIQSNTSKRLDSWMVILKQKIDSEACQGSVKWMKIDDHAHARHMPGVVLY